MKHFDDPVAKKKLLARLRRVEGQIGALCRMVEEEKYCVDILLQISAAQGALGKPAKCFWEPTSKRASLPRSKAVLRRNDNSRWTN